MTSTQSISLIITQQGRLDKTLALAAQAQVPQLGLSRARLQQLIKAGQVTCGGQVADDPKTKVVPEAVFDLIVPDPDPASPEPQEIPLSILFEDEDLIVLNKPAGLVVHPAAGNWDGTLVNALLFHCGDSLSGIGGVARPGIVHRLDKDTSGLMVVAKNDFAHQALTSQFSDRTLSRVYKALIWGVPSPLAGEIQANISRHARSRQKMSVVTEGGKEALTYYQVLDVLAEGHASLVECKLATGRTHQIRVHMAHIGHSVIGDPVYSGRRNRGKAQAKQGFIGKMQGFGRQALHAGEIAFIHPRTEKKMHFQAPMPEDMEKFNQHLENRKSVIN